LDEAELAEARGVLAEVECARQDAEGESASGKRSMSSRFLLRVHLPACPPQCHTAMFSFKSSGPYECFHVVSAGRPMKRKGSSGNLLGKP